MKKIVIETIEISREKALEVSRNIGSLDVKKFISEHQDEYKAYLETLHKEENEVLENEKK